MRSGALALLAALLVASCGGSGGDLPKPPPDRAVIAGWLEALNAHDYRRAAGYFAPGAIVEQGQVIRLPDRAAAVAFNRGLPCRGKLTSVKDEGRTSLGVFDLVAGSGGPRSNCDGSVTVRFRIEAGRFTRWRQLPQAPPVGGSEA